MPVQRAAVVVGKALGLILWVVLVLPLDDAETSAPLFWWAMVGAALVLGLVFGRHAGVPAAMALVVAPLVIAPWTAPRGDGDGLWLLWLPMLGLLSIPLAVAAWASGSLRRIVDRPE